MTGKRNKVAGSILKVGMCGEDQKIAAFGSSYRCRITANVANECQPVGAAEGCDLLLLIMGESAASQGLLGELHPCQAMGDQRADVAMIAAFRRRQHRTIMLAEGQ